MEPLNYWLLPEQWLTEPDDTDLPEPDEDFGEREEEGELIGSGVMS